MRLSQAEIQYLLRTIRKFFPKEQYELLLFGSYARGAARESSDIDIAIKGGDKIPAGRWQMLESEFEESSFPKKVDLVDYYRVSDDFRKIIDRDGQPLA